MNAQTNLDTPTENPLIALVLECQACYARWQTAPSPELQHRHREEYRRLCDLLWQQLAEDLHRRAHRWLRSGMAPDTQSLAMGMFVYIIAALPKLTIDPQRNVRNLLLKIAFLGTIDEYRESFRDTPRRSAGASADEGPHMWPQPGAADRLAAHQPDEPVDPESYDAENRMAARIDREHVLATVWGYWPRQLAPIDLQIMRLRWSSDPPISFNKIAQMLGNGWEEDAVRQRHHRIMKDTRVYLRRQGLIDDTDAAHR